MNALAPAEIVAAGGRLLARPLHLVRELTGGQHAVTLLATDGAESYVVRAFPHESPAVGIAEQMANALAKIHRLDGTGLRPEPQQPPQRPGRLSARAHEEWSRIDSSSRVLTHFDFWSGNALWKGDELVGVVDWNGARWAPRGVDVAWCRQDLVLLGSVSAADLFLRRYEDDSGHHLTGMQAWDILAAAHADPHVESWDVNYAGIGRSDVTPAVLRERFDRWSEELLR